jgi:hypothetical protein
MEFDQDRERMELNANSLRTATWGVEEGTYTEAEVHIHVDTVVIRRRFIFVLVLLLFIDNAGKIFPFQRLVIYRRHKPRSNSCGRG